MRRIPHAFATRRGWTRSGPPPLTARRRLAAGALALGFAVVLMTGCSSSGAEDSSATPPSTGLRIPTPFEVGQQVGAGDDLTLDVQSFQRAGRTVNVTIDVSNDGAAPVTIVPQRAIRIFYRYGPHDAVTIAGSGAPIPPGSTSSYTATFDVPPKYRFPLLWFTAGVPGVQPTTVVLRPAAAG